MKRTLLVVASAAALWLSACNLCSLAGSCLSCASGLCSLPSLLVQQPVPPDEAAPRLVSLPVDEATPAPAAMCY